ncbi:hypothetical protein F4808DRAFT_408797 [Astrocystis sublimbata]|nr:hypothetical protein F4808DRAFT_408797 [Astrocystis sublimbata]
MAFQQPRQAAQRVYRPAPEQNEPTFSQLAIAQPVDDSQTWVLFSPATEAGTSSYGSNITPGRSRYSDLGSLDTIAPSEPSAQLHRSESFIDAVDEDDDGELDSLDSHLPEFRSTPDIYGSSEDATHATHVLPAHDGLGSFRLEQDGMGADIQNRLYSFEQYNPRRVKRRRESLELARRELEAEEGQEIDKIRRIENWRLEQSRYLLDEIQKETRRRRRSVASASNTHQVDHRVEGTTKTSANGGHAQSGVDEDWHDQDADDVSDEHDSLLSRITRKVIQDLMGIDDKMLSILFGEELPDEDDLSTTPKASSALPLARADDRSLAEPTLESAWQVKMLEKIAKELGSLVHQISEHPGAFSTFNRMQQMPIPYAGLQAIPESVSHPVPDTTASEEPAIMPEFQPTIPRPIEVPQPRHSSSSVHGKTQIQADSDLAFTQDEWEQDLDIRLVFRYLRSRFLPHSTSSGLHGGTSHLAASTMNAKDAAAKAARVRQHHPLVSRSRNVEKRKSKPMTATSPTLFRPASSCASQSTRRSVRRSSASSSRHYWDIGGSVGTGSMIATTGAMGSWGEV